MQRPGPDLAAHRWTGGHGPSHYPTSAGEGDLAGLRPVIFRMLDTFSEITVLNEMFLKSVINCSFSMLQHYLRLQCKVWVIVSLCWCVRCMTGNDDGDGGIDIIGNTPLSSPLHNHIVLQNYFL